MTSWVQYTTHQVRCSDCNGTGIDLFYRRMNEPPDREPCWTCSGTGVVTEIASRVEVPEAFGEAA